MKRNSLKIDKEIEYLLEKLKKIKKVKAVVLFGSYAKGTQKKTSDLDIAVLVDKWDKNLEAEVSSLSSNFYDVVIFDRLPLYIKFEVFKYGNILFVSDEDFLNKIKLRVLKDYIEMSRIYNQLKESVLK